MTQRYGRSSVLARCFLTRCVWLMLALLTGAAEASPAPATGPSYPERMSSLMKAAYQRAPVTNPRAGELIDTGDRAYAANQYVEAERAYREALDYVDPQQDALARAQILLSKGSALRKLGQARAAGQPLRDALAVFLAVEGADSLRAGLVLLETSTLQKGENDTQAAEESALRAYRIFERRLGPTDAQTLIALRVAVQAQHDEDAPERLEALMLPKLAAIEGPTSMASESLRGYFDHMLGFALIHLLRDKEAETYLRKALEHYKKARPAEPGEAASCELDLSEALIHQNRKEEAQTLVLPATQYFRTRGEPMTSGGAFFQLAKMYVSLADYPKATKAYEDTVASYLKSKDPHSVLFVYRARMMESVAICSGGNCPQGEKLARSVLDRLQALYPNHRFTADAYQSLGVILQSEQKYPQAASAFRTALNLHKSLFVPPIIQVQTGMSLGVAYYAAEKLSEATAAFQAAIDEADAARLPRDEGVADTKELLGEILYSQGRIPEAEKVLLSAGDDYEALPGSHPRGILQIFFLGLVGYSIGRPGAAVNEVQPLLQVFEDPNHIGGLVLTQRLRALALGELGRSLEAKDAEQKVTELCKAGTVGAERACGIIERPNWIIRCPPCTAKTRASSIELLRALNAYGFSIGQT